MAKPFWVVWQPDSGPPTKQHLDEVSARREAERLARQVPGRAFYVLEAVASYEKTDVRITEFRDSNPF